MPKLHRGEREEMNIWSNVKAWWNIYTVELFRGPQDTKEESAEEWLARKFPLESEWEDD